MTAGRLASALALGYAVLGAGAQSGCSSEDPPAAEVDGAAAADATPAIDSEPPGEPDAAGPPDAQSVTEIGWPTPFDQWAQGYAADSLFAFQVMLPTRSTLTGWGVIAVGANTQVDMRMALYDDDAFAPDALIATSPEFTAADGEVAATPVELAPGTYWLAINADDDLVLGRHASDPALFCNRTLAFDAPMPTSFGPPALCSDALAVNLYATVDPTGGTP